MVELNGLLTRRYAGFLCLDLGWTNDLDRAGFIAGWLGTSLIVGRLPTAVLWGAASDRFGRRTCLLASFLSIAIGNVMFGLCRSLVEALIARFVFLGMGNGWVTVAGTMSGEIAGSKQQNAVTAYMMAAGSMVQLVGPAFAALLYGRGSAKHPALAPSLFGGAFATFVFCLGLAWLPETLEQRAYEVVGHNKRRGVVVSRSWRALVCRNPNFAVAAWLRFATGTCLFAMFDVLPLWAISSIRSGGLALSMNQLAFIVMLAALGQVTFNVVFMARIMRRIGQRAAVCCAGIIAALASVAIPLVGRGLLAHAPYFSRLAALAPLIMLFYAAGAMSFTAVSAMVNNAVPDELRGAANGLATMLEAIGKASGPTLGATAFAYSIAQEPGIIGGTLTFAAIALLLITCAASTLALDSAVENSDSQADDDIADDDIEDDDIEDDQNGNQDDDNTGHIQLSQYALVLTTNFKREQQYSRLATVVVVDDSEGFDATEECVIKNEAGESPNVA